MTERSDLELLKELGVETKKEKKATYTPREERIIAGFEEIQRFVEQHGRAPTHGEDKDIFERLYAIRLERICAQEECRNLVRELDHQGLLDSAAGIAEPPADYYSDAALLAELGMKAGGDNDVTKLKHVKSRAEKRVAEEIATRTPCRGFKNFKPLFETVQRELDDKLRVTLPFRDNAEISKGNWFILSGQKAYVAEVGKEFTAEYDRRDRRLRVIYDNATESDILLRSLQRALNKDPTARRIIDCPSGPLLSGQPEEKDLASGTIYVLRSKSEHPVVAENREIIHKIGVTGGDVEKRIANAENDPTFLLAGVEIVATYELFNINRTKLENLIHKFFSPARLEIDINDRFGKPVQPREWFMVPVFAIDKLVERIQDGSISEYYYDPKCAEIRHRKSAD